jgi:hypothetical protein
LRGAVVSVYLAVSTFKAREAVAGVSVDAICAG